MTTTDGAQVFQNLHCGRCATCGKFRYGSRRSALRVAHQLHPGQDMNAYQCGDWWHYGNAQPRDDGGLAVALRAEVRRCLVDAQMSQAEAAQALGLSTKHMSQMLTGRAVLTLVWAERIVALGGRQLEVTTREALVQAAQEREQLRARAEQAEADAARWRRVQYDIERAANHGNPLDAAELLAIAENREPT